jgi:hypothetical protein
MKFETRGVLSSVCGGRHIGNATSRITAQLQATPRTNLQLSPRDALGMHTTRSSICEHIHTMSPTDNVSRGMRTDFQSQRCDQRELITLALLPRRIDTPT